jgi:anti-sigma factor RsiW
MINCTDMELLISDYADGIADARTRRIVERHVQLCMRCRSRMQRAQQVAQQLRRLPLLPAGVSSRSVRFRRHLEDRLAQTHRRREYYPMYLYALLATALLALIVLTLAYFGG